MPVIANGEIWNPEDFERCRAVTGCDRFMLGRGLLARPDLARAIKAQVAGEEYTPMPWREVCQMLHRYYRMSQPHWGTKNASKYCGNRIKQWLMYLQRQYPEAATFFEQIKREREPARFEAAFRQAA